MTMNYKDKVFIIAEAGVNHNGSIKLAKELVDVAVESGADAVKFQTFKAEAIVAKSASKADYQKRLTGSEESQFEMLKKLELAENEFKQLHAYCYEKKIEFLSTPFDLQSVDFLESLDMRIFKIPSGEITNLPYLRKIGEIGKPVIISTGMSILAEVENAINILKKAGCIDISVLHCNTEYPTPFADVNLQVMRTMRNALGLPIGYSDHTPGVEASIAAVALGATIIEKHFTLDKTMDGPDHLASLPPVELNELVRMIRNVELVIGDDTVKRITDSEKGNRIIARRSIVAAKKIEKGEILTEDNLICKRPGNGISPMEWDRIVGRVAIKNFDIDEFIEI